MTSKRPDVGTPVEVVRPCEEVSGALVVGLSAQRASEAALRRAVVLGGRLQSTMHIVHVVSLEDFPIDPDSDGWSEQAGATVELLRVVTRDALEGYRFGWSFRVLHGEPGEGIAGLARAVHPDFVVLGARDGGWHGRLERLTIPSVSRHLINDGLSVLVVSHDRDGGPVISG